MPGACTWAFKHAPHLFLKRAPTSIIDNGLRDAPTSITTKVRCTETISSLGLSFSTFHRYRPLGTSWNWNRQTMPTLALFAVKNSEMDTHGCVLKTPSHMLIFHLSRIFQLFNSFQNVVIRPWNAFWCSFPWKLSQPKEGLLYAIWVMFDHIWFSWNVEK